MDNMIRISMRCFNLLIFTVFLFSTVSCSQSSGEAAEKKEQESPRIVNIVNFIRECEPRIDWITEDVLYQTVVSQIAEIQKYDLPATFLLQYDALIDPRYQKLLRALPAAQFEIGAWWEIPQPLVENSGMKWRGRYPWDWNADVGFSTGYTPEEREKLVDTYMKDFKKVFGHYPKSVGSWFIDAHTLEYMVEKYGIVASCNCKDQVGTDGYTLWGGYWNQAYYPSRKNAYMPAQHQENQIQVPVFRMLGSDPIHQYDSGLGTENQHVVSLEPVYTHGGGDSTWVNWYFEQFLKGPSMAFGYVQAGQENSFTWKRMKKGFEIQLPLIAKLKNEGKIEVENLGETGEWFQKNFKVTPATSVTALQDYSDKNQKTVWFNSRFYRANLLWEKGTLRFRDIHMFDENVQSDYLNEKGTTTSCYFYTLPVVDGFMWSSANTVAGLRFVFSKNDSLVQVAGDDPVVDDSQRGKLNITWPVHSPEGKIIMNLDESSIMIHFKGGDLQHCFLKLNYDHDIKIPLESTDPESINYNYRGHPYSVHAIKGKIVEDPSGLKIIPDGNRIILDLAKGEKTAAE